MRKFIIILILLIAGYAFREYSVFEKRLIANFSGMVINMPQEKVYLHTDKSVYTVGENIWFRAYQVHATTHSPMLLSHYIYVDIVDKRDSLVTRVKVKERDSCFYGQIRLPENLQQGDYCLRAYTYYMQNQGEDFIFKKKIRVLNPQDSRVWIDVSYTRKGKDNYIARLRFTDYSGEPYVRLPLVYVKGERVNRYSELRTVTDRDGVVELKIDKSVKNISLKSADYADVSFEREIHVPDHLADFDVQFFPEGGNLLSNNWQVVAFKAIGEDGRAVHVTGGVYLDTVLIADIHAEHDGMGAFRLPVMPGQRYYAVMRQENGLEQRFELPLPVNDGWGLSVNVTDSCIIYNVLKGEKTVPREDLYAVLHCRGMIIDIQPIRGEVKGIINPRLLPEGIFQLVLMDEQGNVYSQRMFFRKLKSRPALKVQPAKPSYTARELVELEIGFEDLYADKLAGTFSLTVTDDQKVTQDSLENNILSDLLLTADLKGYIDNPAYYFNDTTPLVDRHLDLVMLTHGWTRFDPAKVARGEFPEQQYEIELGQVISGRVKNFWGGQSKQANIILISNYGHVREVNADEAGHFLVDNIAFHDSTEFFVQALSRKGRKGVEVVLDPDRFLPPVYSLPNTVSDKKAEDDFLKRFSQDYYYEDGVKVYVLDEVQVTRRKRQKTYSFYDNLATHAIDSMDLAEYSGYDWDLLIQELPGVMIERGEDGEECFTRFGKKLYTLVNDFEESMQFIRLIPIRAVKHISYLDAMQARIFFGDRAPDGALIISMDPGYTPPPIRPANTLAFKPLGFQVPDEFYVPKYDVDSVRRDPRYDVRSTIYWQPVLELSPGKKQKVSFYTADIYGTYSVIIEGVTREGIICRQRLSLPIK